MNDISIDEIKAQAIISMMLKGKNVDQGEEPPFEVVIWGVVIRPTGVDWKDVGTTFIHRKPD